MNSFDFTKEKIPKTLFTPMTITWIVLATIILIYYLVLRQHILHSEDTKAEILISLFLLIVTIGAFGGSLIIYLLNLIMSRPFSLAYKFLKIGLFSSTLLVLMVALSQMTAYTPKIDGVNPISELRKIEVNGRTEWLLIRGEDRTKPIVLFLSGGPGGSQLATSRYHFKALESDYVVVTWEQPGAAKSYGAIHPSDITLETYLDDGLEVVKYLREEFKQPKIHVMGESWGSAIGLMMVHEHPEYYYSFIGTGQMIDFLETERIDYQMALDDARKLGNKELVSKLEKQGPPPYTSGVALKTNAYLAPLYATMSRAGKLNGTAFSTVDGPFGVEYGLIDKVNFVWGLYRTFDVFYPKLYYVNLRERCPVVEVPLYFFHGRYDYNAPVQLVEDYMKNLKAPKKSLIFFEFSGHNPWQTENELFVKHAIEVFQESER